MTSFDELVPITPVNFFELTVDCHYIESKGSFPRLNPKNGQKYLLPDTSVLCNEEHFADVFMGWNEEFLELLFLVDKPVEQSFYPEVVRGDSIELFIDTRDVKTSGYNTRFCHHFFFLPEAIEGHQAGEITHFRTEDAHPLCDPADLKIDAVIKRDKYSLSCLIPQTCLVGYDPTQFKRLGLSYRINRPKWQSQHFSVVTEDYQLEQQPSLWSHVRLIK